MGYRGKLVEREDARRLRAQGLTLLDIAQRLGVSKSSVSLWTRDVDFTPGARRPARRNGPNVLERRKAAEISALLVAGREHIGRMSEKEFLVLGAALYAGEGSKTDGAVCLANTDPRFIALICAWLRHFFEIDESRLRLKLYLHEGLDLNRAIAFWSELTRIPPAQFTKPYRAVPDAGIRNNKHEYGCATIAYSCSRTHRAVIGLVHAVLDPLAQPIESGGTDSTMSGC